MTQDFGLWPAHSDLCYQFSAAGLGLSSTIRQCGDGSQYEFEYWARESRPLEKTPFSLGRVTVQDADIFMATIHYTNIEDRRSPPI